MKVSSLLGLSLGWVLTALAVALDVGAQDPLFWPALAMTLPAVLGLGGVLRSLRQKPEPLEAKRVIGFAVVGGVLVTVAVLLIIAGMYWNKPPPGAQQDQGGVIIDEQFE